VLGVSERQRRFEPCGVSASRVKGQWAPTGGRVLVRVRSESLLEAVGDVRFRPDAETVKLALADCRDRLYFDELVGIAQDRNAKQRAGDVVVTKVSSYDLPDGQQVLTPLTGDVHSRFCYVGQVSAGGMKGSRQVGDDLLGLPGSVADRHGCAELVEGTSACCEDKL
jgi:hypothetical protein